MLKTEKEQVVAELVAAYETDPDRLDPDLRGDWAAADGDAAALRVLVDRHLGDPFHVHDDTCFERDGHEFSETASGTA